MASNPATPDSATDVLPAVGVGLIVAITLLTAVALAVLAVLVVG